MPKHLVLAGAGHAHVVALTRLKEITDLGHKVSVIGPGERHYYSGMGPGMLGGTYNAEDISFPVRSMVEEAGGEFVMDKVTGCDPQAREVFLQSGEKLNYDVISFNTGSAIPDEIVDPEAQNLFRVKPIENLQAGRERILDLAKEREVRIGVVGGGPGALEVGGNAWAAAKESGGKGASVRIYAGSGFMHKAPNGVTQRAREVFNRRGIELIEGVYVDKVETNKVTLQDGRSFEEDLIFLTTGVVPRPIFGPSGLKTGPEGGLLVNEFLQCPAYPEIFGGGDCIFFKPLPLDKVGVYAVRQNPILFSNLLATLEGKELTPFDPGGAYLLIYNLGDHEGILHKWGIIFNGSIAFKIKDYIDRKFMLRFMPVG